MDKSWALGKIVGLLLKCDSCVLATLVKIGMEPQSMLNR